MSTNCLRACNGVDDRCILTQRAYLTGFERTVIARLFGAYHSPHNYCAPWIHLHVMIMLGR